MKNRYLHRAPNGKIFCIHNWRPNGKVGPDWDNPLHYVPVKCSKCDKVTEIRSTHIDEWPDELIDKCIQYV